MKLLNPLIKKFKKVTPPKNKNVKFALIAGLATMFFVAPVVTNVATTYQVFDPDIVSNKEMINILKLIIEENYIKTIIFSFFNFFLGFFITFMIYLLKVKRCKNE